ncbi:MAG: MFS transporter, partial [Vulcanisaeta sp.]
GLAYNGGTWLAAWAAIITTMMAGASKEPGPWLTAITINTILGGILIVVSVVMVVFVIKNNF